MEAARLMMRWGRAPPGRLPSITCVKLCGDSDLGSGTVAFNAKRVIDGWSCSKTE